MTIQSYYTRNPIQGVEQGMKVFYAKLTVGATGAVSATAGYGLNETTPIVRNSAGNYTITFDRAFQKLLKAGHTMILGTPQDLVMTVTSDDIAASGALTVEFSTGTTATDPSSGAIIIFEVIVADSSLNGGI